MVSQDTCPECGQPDNCGDCDHTPAHVKTFGVFEHSSGPQGGFVVRTIYDGWCPYPYSNSEPVKVYQREHAAQRYADHLNDNGA